jgi:hypothetical protein
VPAGHLLDLHSQALLGDPALERRREETVVRALQESKDCATSTGSRTPCIAATTAPAYSS